MAFRLVIAEKPSMAQTIAAALGIKGKQDGYIERAAATSFHGASGIWYSLRKLPPTGSNIKNGVLTAYPFCRRNGSTPLTRTRGSNSKPLKSLCTAPTFPKW